MKLEDATSFARRWCEAWNAHDIGRIIDMYASGVEFHSPFARLVTGDGRVVGREALLAYWTKGLALSPRLHFDIIEVLAGDDSLTAVYRDHNDRRVAETFVFGADGKVVHATACYGAETAADRFAS